MIATTVTFRWYTSVLSRSLEFLQTNLAELKSSQRQKKSKVCNGKTTNRLYTQPAMVSRCHRGQLLHFKQNSNSFSEVYLSYGDVSWFLGFHMFCYGWHLLDAMWLIDHHSEEQLLQMCQICASSCTYVLWYAINVSQF